MRLVAAAEPAQSPGTDGEVIISSLLGHGVVKGETLRRGICFVRSEVSLAARSILKA